MPSHREEQETFSQYKDDDLQNFGNVLHQRPYYHDAFWPSIHIDFSDMVTADKRLRIFEAYEDLVFFHQRPGSQDAGCWQGRLGT